MRRFLCTAQFFTGEIEVVYDGTGRLVRFDVAATDLPAVLVKNFKEKVPALVDELPTAFKNLMVLEADYQVSFIEFWNAYDHKVNKKRCEPVWEKLSMADRIKALHGVALYKKHLAKLPYKRAEADPERYLKDRYWENEWK